MGSELVRQLACDFYSSYENNVWFGLFENPYIDSLVHFFNFHFLVDCKDVNILVHDKYPSVKVHVLFHDGCDKYMYWNGNRDT